ncbi:restriction endonuclease subunit S [Streptomyces sp. NPDC048420]|uniref:restriction endonuclease subunit S n=1 Tax=Streptomyces sp. NPDC048420 TaxID=3155755 RepID=UPI0034182D75
MSEWNRVPLESLLKSGVSYGIVQPGSAEATGVPIVRVKDVRNGRIDTSDPLRVSPDVEVKYSRTRLQGGEVLLTLVGSTGQVAVASDRLAGWNVARAIGVLRPISDISPRWLQYFIESEVAQQYIREHLNTTVQATLNLKDVRVLPVPLPPRQEREGIISVIGALDDKIAVNERIANTASELASAHFRRQFALALKHVSDGTPPPPEWTLSTIGASASIVETGTRPKGGVAQYTSGVPSIGAESVIGLGKFDFSKTKFIPEEFFTAMRRGIVQDRDILVYKDGGKPGDFKPHVTLFGNGFPFPKMCINEHVYRVRLMPSIGQEFCYYWLSSEPLMTEMRRRGTGAAIPGMNSTAFKNLPLVIPAPEIIESFTRVAAPLVDRALMSAAESRTLAALRDTLLPQLMSGRLRVKDAEKIVEDHT